MFIPEISMLFHFSFLMRLLNLFIFLFQIGLNFDHDTTTGNLGGAVPRVRWDSDEMSVAGLFDVQVR